MTTFKELETNINLYMGQPSIELDKLTNIAKVLYATNRLKYDALLKTFVDIEKDLSEYVRPANLEHKILDSLNQELYLKNPDKYKTCVMKLENLARQKNNYKLGLELTLTLFKYSNYTYSGELHTCLRNYTTLQICESSLTQDLKVQVLQNSITIMPSWNIPSFLQGLAKTISTEQLDGFHQLKLVHSLIYCYQHISKIPVKQRTYLNQIIEKISITSETKPELIKLLATPKLLTRQNMTTITGLYPAGNFKSILKTAQALGLENNPDYWVQSLPSQQSLNMTNQVELPVFE